MLLLGSVVETAINPEFVMNEVFPVLHVRDVDEIADWAVASLGLRENWRAAGESGITEHAELLWHAGRISINIHRGGPQRLGGISLRVADRQRVDAAWQQAQAVGTNITQSLAESKIAYSFTATDPAGNEWWVNCETGLLDQLRKEK